MPHDVIGHLTVLLGCHRCGQQRQVRVAVWWDGGKPQVRDDAELYLWREAHQQPWAVTP